MTQDDKLKIENAVRDILQAIGENPERDGLKARVECKAHLVKGEIALRTDQNGHRFVVDEQVQLIEQIFTLYLTVAMGYISMSCGVLLYEIG